MVEELKGGAAQPLLFRLPTACLTCRGRGRCCRRCCHPAAAAAAVSCTAWPAPGAPADAIRAAAGVAACVWCRPRAGRVWGCELRSALGLPTGRGGQVHRTIDRSLPNGAYEAMHSNCHLTRQPGRTAGQTRSQRRNARSQEGRRALAWRPQQDHRTSRWRVAQPAVGQGRPLRGYRSRGAASCGWGLPLPPGASSHPAPSCISCCKEPA